MLSYLQMRSFALIDELTLEFFEGLNVLTGETGAGKSILIGAINLILGERASSEQVRTGSELAIIEAVFNVNPDYEELIRVMEMYGIPFDHEIVIRREISRSGRNTCRVNGSIIPLASLKDVGNVLVDLHGQHSQQSLLKTEQHINVLDEFGDSELLDEKRKLADLYDHFLQKKKKLKERGVSPEERTRQLDFLKYQRDEILEASLSAEEEESLRQRLLLLDNMEKLISAINNAYSQIYGGETDSASVLDKINISNEEISSLLNVDPELISFTTVLQEVSAGLTELGHDLYSYMDKLTYFPEEREEIENRLELYRRLKSKYGASVIEIFSFLEKCDQEIMLLENSEEEMLRLENDYIALKKEIDQSGEIVTKKRKETAKKLEKQVEGSLRDLDMQNARFIVNFSTKERTERNGKEHIEFLFSANLGEPPLPMTKIISAGEMARVMLALKSILAEQDRIPTLIFDEIDSGIAGKTIQNVSRKMAGLSEKHQIICVTHSPHLASAADHQFNIYKELIQGRTSTRVKYLDQEKRVLEISRMLDGSTGEITILHAQELIKKNQKIKQNTKKLPS
jgi:DNA repair protein RecN (Recombination protein N)